VEKGEVRVPRVVAAIDPGHVVNPLSVEMQVQGAIVYALTGICRSVTSRGERQCC